MGLPKTEDSSTEKPKKPPKRSMTAIDTGDRPLKRIIPDVTVQWSKKLDQHWLRPLVVEITARTLVLRGEGCRRGIGPVSWTNVINTLARGPNGDPNRPTVFHKPLPEAALFRERAIADLTRAAKQCFPDRWAELLRIAGVGDEPKQVAE